MSGRVFHQELVFEFLDNQKILILGPLAVAVAAFVGLTFGTRDYVSSALIRIDKSTARSAEILLMSPAAAEKVMGKRAGLRSQEERIEFLHSNVQLVDTDPSIDGPHLFRLEVSATNPAQAQSIGVDLIDAWLETTKPGSVDRAILKAKLENAQLEAATETALVEQLKSEAKALVLPSSEVGELATPIANLLRKRNENLVIAADIERQLGGLPHDVIVEAPHLPQYPSKPHRLAKSVLAGFVSIPLFLATIVLFRFFASRLPIQKPSSIGAAV
jgi:hypothetical protein